MSNQPQDHAKARFGQESSVLGIGDLPYFTQGLRWDVGAFEEGDGTLAGQHAEIIGVGLGEEVGEGAFFFMGEIQEGLVYISISIREGTWL